MKRFRSFVYRTQTLYNWILETTLQSKVFTGYRPYIHINTKFVPLVSICQVTPYKLLICFSSAGVVNSSWRTVKTKQATSAGKLRVNFIDSWLHPRFDVVEWPCLMPIHDTFLWHLSLMTSVPCSVLRCVFHFLSNTKPSAWRSTYRFQGCSWANTQRHPRRPTADVNSCLLFLGEDFETSGICFWVGGLS